MALWVGKSGMLFSRLQAEIMDWEEMNWRANHISGQANG